MSEKISVVVRLKNEKNTIGTYFSLIRKQTVKAYEIILVDNNSKDQTVEIARRFGCKVINIPDNQFNHVSSCNLGAEKHKEI